MVGEEIDVTVIEVDRERRRLILSERAASSETRDSIKERVIDELKEGEVRTGRVTSLADFGAFVNINGADGLVHLSEISWEHVNHPSEVLEVGQEIKVKIISIDVDRKRIGLSIRRMKDDPWSDQIAKLTEGQLVEGRITRLTNFGAFARLLVEDIDGELEGLIHISEISERRIEHPKEVLHEGEVVTLRIIKIEEDTHRIGLSLRRVDSPAYSDLDWKTLTDEFDVEELADEFAGEAADGETAEVETEVEAEVEAEVETEVEAEVEDEVEPETEAEVEAEVEPEIETDVEVEEITEAVTDETVSEEIPELETVVDEVEAVASEIEEAAEAVVSESEDTESEASEEEV